MSAVSPLTGRPPPVSPGRPRGARTRLSDKLLNELAEKFEQHGAAAMDVVAKRMLEKFLAFAFGILPRDVLIEVVEQRRPGGLDAAEWELMLRVLEHVPSQLNQGDSLRAKDERVYRH